MFILLPSILLFAFGNAMIAYPDYAEIKGWPVGAAYRRDGSWLSFLAIGAMVTAIVLALLIHTWWGAILTVPIGFFLSLFVTNLSRQWIQVIAPLAIVGLYVFSIFIMPSLH